MHYFYLISFLNTVILQLMMAARGEVLKTVICLLPVILVWKIMGKYLKAVTNVKPVIFS